MELLAVFGVGTLAGMLLVTAGLASTFAAAARRWPGFGSGTRVVTGLASVALGAWLIVQIGFVDGFFRARRETSTWGAMHG